LPVRAHPIVLGTVLFLSSELMFFAALFAAYFYLRMVAAAPWPPPDVRLDPIESSAGTALLLLSDLATILTTRALDRRREAAGRAWVAVALLLAIGFVGLSLHGWSQNAFTFSTHAYGSMYYAMTGFHLLHVVAGIGLLAALFIGFYSPALRANRRAGAEAMLYYWHFVFVVWLGIWTTIYFIR
jgi:heme/copper-type cytochrome/quinol oxidase subunit 3